MNGTALPVLLQACKTENDIFPVLGTGLYILCGELSFGKHANLF